MKKYLVALDLDGTLLNNKKEISVTTKNYLTKLTEAGHKIVLVTGRPYRGCVNFHKELNLDTPLICNNGNSIFNMGTNSFPNYTNFMDKKTADEIFRFMKDDLVMAFYNVGDNFYSYKTKGKQFNYYHIEEDTKIIARDLDHIDNEPPIIKLYFIPVSAQEKFETFMENYPDILYRSWGTFDGIILYEIHNNNADKGTALLKVANYLNVDKEDIISFGDGVNDFELLNVAGHGVFMINGNEELKKTTKHKTTYTNDNDGVIKYLEDFLKKNA